MRSVKFVISLVFCTIFCSGCGTLNPAVATYYNGFGDYDYFYITPTNGVASSVGSVSGDAYGISGGMISKSINPSDVISGYLLKRGYILLPELSSDLKDKTLIVNYGESGRRDMFLAYAIEITIQFLSAKDHSIMCVGTAEGLGDTEADDVRIAINRCLDKMFSPYE